MPTLTLLRTGEPNWDSGSADDFSMRLSQQDAPTCQAALVTNGVKGELPGETGGGWEEGSDTMGPFITQGGTVSTATVCHHAVV